MNGVSRSAKHIAEAIWILTFFATHRVYVPAGSCVQSGISVPPQFGLSTLYLIDALYRSSSDRNGCFVIFWGRLLWNRWRESSPEAACAALHSIEQSHYATIDDRWPSGNMYFDIPIYGSASFFASVTCGLRCHSGIALHEIYRRVIDSTLAVTAWCTFDTVNHLLTSGSVHCPGY